MTRIPRRPRPGPRRPTLRPGPGVCDGPVRGLPGDEDSYYRGERSTATRPGFRAWDRDRHELAATAEAPRGSHGEGTAVARGRAPPPASTGRARRRPVPRLAQREPGLDEPRGVAGLVSRALAQVGRTRTHSSPSSPETRALHRRSRSRESPTVGTGGRSRGGGTIEAVEERGQGVPDGQHAPEQEIHVALRGRGPCGAVLRFGLAVAVGVHGRPLHRAAGRRSPWRAGLLPR